MSPLGLMDPATGPIAGWTGPISILEAKSADGRRKHLMWYERSRDGSSGAGVIWKSASYDGGLTWGESRAVVNCAGASEPAAIRSPDGTFVATTYIQSRPGAELQSIVSIRFRLDLAA